MLLGYLVTLAPTVTLWDAGEFITAAKVLGIPHPPGTPLFVLLSHVWADVLPVGGYAWRLNLMSAVWSAAGAGCWFLVCHRLLSDHPRLWRVGGAAAAAIASAFTFTVWQNSTETEVYSVATFTIAAVAWLAMRWRDARGTPRAPRILLLIVYFEALSIGNHLLALLVGPAVLAFLFHALRAAPAAAEGERRTEWAELGVLTALWVALLAVGLGSTPLLIVSGVLLLVAAAFAVRAGSLVFPLVVVAVAAAGISTYAYLYIRSGLEPRLDMADPDTWRSLVAVIRREQYPARTPWDNPLFPSGAGNPGRTLTLIWQQLVNYFQYFDWQWANGVAALRLATTVLFGALGVLGVSAVARRDRPGLTLLGALWLITGLGLVAYMNFKPGFSLFWAQYPTIDQHEVRERDYFFTVSYQVWALVAGVGLVELARRVAARWSQLARWTPALLVIAVLPFPLNFTAATRRGPDAQLARDFAYNMLQSIGPYGILFVVGDNDTYPLWYAQEVEGVRQDVAVVNLMLANTDWYLRTLAHGHTRAFDPAGAPSFYRAPPMPSDTLLPITDSMVERLTGFRLDRDVLFRPGHIVVPFANGTALFPSNQAMIMLLDRHLGRRPIGFAISTGRGTWMGLDRYLVQRGLVYEVFDGQPDTAKILIPGIQRLWVDTARTRALAEDVFRYGPLFAIDTLRLEPAADQVATSFAAVYLELAQTQVARRDQSRVLFYLRKAEHLNPNPQITDLIHRIEAEGLDRVLPPPQAPASKP